MNKLIVGYARVSVKENGESIINQIELIKAYCKTNSLNLDKCYIDNGKSHLNSNYFLTMDIKKFYDNCSREYVFFFFFNR